MNPKFFDVKKEKQDAIINAALMVFAENGYKKASTDIIVKEAGISKGLLFHYFISKQGLYEFVYDYSVKYMVLELTQSVKKTEEDFFEIQRGIELAKTRVMKNYPYMQQFLSNVKFETADEALSCIIESKGQLEELYSSIYRQADLSKFYSMIDVEKVVSMIGWMSDGFIKEKFRKGNPDLDEMNGEFTQYLSMLRDHFYKDSGRGLSAIIDEIENNNDSAVMDSIREALGRKATKEMTFEERLAAGKKPLVELPPQEEKVVEVKEPEVVEESPVLTEDEIKNAAKEAMMEAYAVDPQAEEKAVNDMVSANVQNSLAMEVERILNEEKSLEDAEEAEVSTLNDIESVDSGEEDTPEDESDKNIEVDTTADIAEETKVQEVASEDEIIDEDATDEDVSKDEVTTVEATEEATEEATDEATEEATEEATDEVTIDNEDEEVQNEDEDEEEPASDLESGESLLGENNKTQNNRSDIREVFADMSEEDKNARDREEMGPAPVLPDIKPDSFNKIEKVADEKDGEDTPNSFAYYPLAF